MMTTDQRPESYYDIFKEYIVNEQRLTTDIEDGGDHYRLKDIYSNDGKKDKPYFLKVNLPNDCIVFQVDRKGNNKLDFLRKDICLPDFIAFCEGKNRLYYFMIELKYPNSRKNVPEKFTMGYYLINFLHSILIFKGQEKKIKYSKECFIFSILANNFGNTTDLLDDLKPTYVVKSPNEIIDYQIFDMIKSNHLLNLNQIVDGLEKMKKPNLTTRY